MKRRTSGSNRKVCLLVFLVGCGPTYMGPPTTLQPPGGYPSGMPAQPLRPQPMLPTVPPDGATAKSLNQVPDVSPDDVFLPPRTGAKATYHRVNPGESISGVAKHYGVTAEELRKANAWAAEHLLKAGDLVLIPK